MHMVGHCNFCIHYFTYFTNHFVFFKVLLLVVMSHIYIVMFFIARGNPEAHSRITFSIQTINPPHTQ
jgi:hypothetical protein